MKPDGRDWKRRRKTSYNETDKGQPTVEGGTTASHKNETGKHDD